MYFFVNIFILYLYKKLIMIIFYSQFLTLQEIVDCNNIINKFDLFVIKNFVDKIFFR